MTLKLFSARARCFRQLQTLGRISALLRQGRARAHGEELRLLPGLDLAIFAQMATEALLAISAALRLPEPSTRSALSGAMQLRADRERRRMCRRYCGHQPWRWQERRYSGWHRRKHDGLRSESCTDSRRFANRWCICRRRRRQVFLDRAKECRCLRRWWRRGQLARGRANFRHRRLKRRGRGLTGQCLQQGWRRMARRRRRLQSAPADQWRDLGFFHLHMLLALLRSAGAAAHCSQLRCLQGPKGTCWAEVTSEALLAIVATLRLPEPCAWLAHSGAVQCRSQRGRRQRRSRQTRRQSQGRLWGLRTATGLLLVWLRGGIWPRGACAG
mmetsp:Transcript_76397/g.169328  ORF Transcript_76397/g.169328 Transcript_76397/m.169328 type:complete len:328 (+) Transcript_76397:549-1532(+)